MPDTMDGGDIRLSEIIQSQKDKYCISSHLYVRPRMLELSGRKLPESETGSGDGN